MNYSIWLIAWRYLIGSQQERNISIMIKICFIGIFIGACSLALVMAIMDGFEHATHEKMQGVHAQLIMKSKGNLLDASSIEPIIKKEFPAIIGFSPQSIGQAILSTDDNNDLANVVMLKAIDPEKESLTSSIATKVISPSSATILSTVVHDNHILIGSQSAATLDLAVGDSVHLIYVARHSHSKDAIDLEKIKTVVGGIFKTGIEEFDAGLVYCSNELFTHMFDQEGVDQISLKLQPGIDEDRMIHKLQKRFGLEIFSWKDLYPALVSALKLEKYVMFIILALITLVASMNMISLLFMQIIQKRGEIAILKAMGMSRRSISAIFFIMGTAIASIASICGLAAAWAIGLLLKRYPLITLPDAYYVSYIPVNLDISVFVIIFASIMLISVIATWLPVRKIKNIQVADILRFEA
jgi:lipoprotein-releasing system permease protein